MSTFPDLSEKSAVILDDNPQMREIIRSMLATVGIRSVSDYSDPHAVVRHLETYRVDLAVIDLVLMSDLDGLAVVDRIRHNPNIQNTTMPIIMVTGYPSIAVIDQAINSGVDELVTKPLRTKDLLARVTKALTKPRRYISTPSDYFGPDRRRADRGAPRGVERREQDLAVEIVEPEDGRAAISRMRADAFTEQRMVDESIVMID
ncbi:MAG: response regulator [Devosiaceae bacterium]|nr:response regulator [Devosiaceae bacterium MH13]